MSYYYDPTWHFSIWAWNVFHFLREVALRIVSMFPTLSQLNILMAVKINDFPAGSEWQAGFSRTTRKFTRTKIEKLQSPTFEGVSNKERCQVFHLLCSVHGLNKYFCKLYFLLVLVVVQSVLLIRGSEFQIPAEGWLQCLIIFMTFLSPYRKYQVDMAIPRSLPSISLQIHCSWTIVSNYTMKSRILTALLYETQINKVNNYIILNEKYLNLYSVNLNCFYHSLNGSHAFLSV
jgi:hypothetical protein